METREMTTKPRRLVGGLPGPAQPSGDTLAAKQPAGRPKGVPSTIVNVRLPLPLVAALDRYLDRLERSCRANVRVMHRIFFKPVCAFDFSLSAGLQAGVHHLEDPIIAFPDTRLPQHDPSSIWPCSS